MSAVGTKRTSKHVRSAVAFGGKADVRRAAYGTGFMKHSPEGALLKDLANAGSEFDARPILHMVHTVPVH